ncbi:MULTISPECIES: CYTH domain-containing protein [Pseudofrankia]|uniref:CYTH domain-containing protein n=1 Tax=Pseudofrankia TaxID=2994363 RepID=UPI000234BD0E|nr:MULTISPECIES: CYTH domain-containing protein [Pseudofrankia]OHV31350.1 adenylate cyclase [Pseudofrankia sp. EUN1h]
MGRQTEQVKRASQGFWRLPERELDRLVELARKTDRVELKLIVPETAHEAVRESLRISFRNARRQRVYYFDTPDRMLFRCGVITRVRRMPDRHDDAVVKLRPVDPAAISPALRRSKRFTVEIDGMPGSYLCSAALKSHLLPGHVEQVARGKLPLHRLLTKPQLRLLTAHLPNGVRLGELVAHGPVDARRRTLVVPGDSRRLLVERWTFPDGSQLLELSTRCRPEEVLHAAARTATVLRDHGIDLTGPQQTKTATALAYFHAHPSMT